MFMAVERLVLVAPMGSLIRLLYEYPPIIWDATYTVGRSGG